MWMYAVHACLLLRVVGIGVATVAWSTFNFRLCAPRKAALPLAKAAERSVAPHEASLALQRAGSAAGAAAPRRPSSRKGWAVPRLVLHPNANRWPKQISRGSTHHGLGVRTPAKAQAWRRHVRKEDTCVLCSKSVEPALGTRVGTPSGRGAGAAARVVQRQQLIN